MTLLRFLVAALVGILLAWVIGWGIDEIAKPGSDLESAGPWLLFAVLAALVCGLAFVALARRRR